MKKMTRDILVDPLAITLPPPLDCHVFFELPLRLFI